MLIGPRREHEGQSCGVWRRKPRVAWRVRWWREGALGVLTGLRGWFGWHACRGVDVTDQGPGRLLALPQQPAF